MNNNFILVLFILVIAAAAYLFVTQENETVPATSVDEPATTNVEDADYVGLSVSAAEAKAEAEGVPFRVVMRDGQPLPATKDYRPGRINATVEGGVVVTYSVEGSAEPTEPDDQVSEPAPDTEAGNHDVIIGMTEAEAEAYAEAEGVPFRVGIRDGEAFPLTMDFRPGRITAEVENGVVVGYSVEG